MKHQVFCHTISLGVYDSKHLLIDYFLIILLIHKNTKQILQSACLVLSCIKLKDFRENEQCIVLFQMWQGFFYFFLCFTRMCFSLWHGNTLKRAPSINQLEILYYHTHLKLSIVYYDFSMVVVWSCSYRIILLSSGWKLRKTLYISLETWQTLSIW